MPLLVVGRTNKLVKLTFIILKRFCQSWLVVIRSVCLVINFCFVSCLTSKYQRIIVNDIYVVMFDCLHCCNGDNGILIFHKSFTIHCVYTLIASLNMSNYFLFVDLLLPSGFKTKLIVMCIESRSLMFIVVITEGTSMSPHPVIIHTSSAD